MVENEASVRLDADSDCAICQGAGWHWGWDRSGYRKLITGGLPPVMLRCPCVDRRRENAVRTACQNHPGAVRIGR